MFSGLMVRRDNARGRKRVVADDLLHVTFHRRDEHSSFWAFTLQKMKTRYDTLMDELRINRNQE